VAGTLGFHRRTVKRNVEKWSKTDPRFAELKYIGQRSIPVTLEEIAILNQRLKKSRTSTKQDLIREINDKRIKRGDSPIPQTTLYRFLNGSLRFDQGQK